MGKINTIMDKLLITGDLKVVTGLHIGASNEFAPIGAVDLVVVRNPIDKAPIIPGSSLKGKMRTLLARTETDSPVLKNIDMDSIQISRLFGTSKHKQFENMSSRLQFFDLFIKEDSKKAFKDKTDLYLTEIKFENTINRLDSVANPRQIERVPAGMNFDFKLIYNVENTDNKNNELVEDFRNIVKALKLLQADYLGGHGTRGYGKVSISNLKINALNINQAEAVLDTAGLEKILKEAENFGLLLV